MKSVASFEIKHHQFLGEQGSLVGDKMPPLARDFDQLTELYRLMSLTRQFDAKAVALQRTGKLGTYASSLGHEAIHVGVGSAMRDEDCFAPMYREYGTLFYRGVKPSEILAYWGGDERGSDWSGQPHDFPICVPIATQCLHAAGAALAFKLRSEARCAVSLVGDGGSSKGDFLEALNAAGAFKLPAVFIIANNQWAISVPRAKQSGAPTLAQKGLAAGLPSLQVDGNDLIAVRTVVEAALKHAREGKGATLIEAITYRLSDHTTADDATRYRGEDEVKAAWEREPLKRLRTYLSAEGGWNDALEEALKADCAAQVDAAVEEYLNMESQPVTAMFDSMYAELPHDLAAQRAAAEEMEMAEITLVEAVTLALAHELKRDERVVVMGEDVGVNGGVFRATAGLQQEFGDERVIDTPLAETMIAGLAVGMAAQGLRPVIEAQFMGFIYPMFDHMLSHAGRLRNRTRGRMHCPMVLRAPFGGGIHAPEHHSESTEALFAHTPGIRVVIPSSPGRAYGLLLAAIRDEDPVVFLEPKRIYRWYKEEVVDDGEDLPLDVCYVLREGTDITLVTWGAMVKETLEAADKLAERGISAEVIDVATISPLDGDTILESVAKTGRCVIVHEAARNGGMGAEIAAQLADAGLYDLHAPVKRVTGYDTVMPLYRLEKKYMPSAERILRAVDAVLGGFLMREFKLPDLGEGLPDAEIVEWHVAEGDTVTVDEPMVSMETAKAVVEVPAPCSGKIVKLHGQAGDVIDTGALLVTFDGEGGEEAPATEGEATQAPEDAPAEAETETTEVREDSGTVVGTMESSDEVKSEAVADASGRKVTPAVRALAKKLKVDLSRVQASGAGGVITARDVKDAAAAGTARLGEKPAKAPATAGPAPAAAAATTEASGEWTAVRGTRRSMARAMAQAHAEVVPTTISEDADVGLWEGKQDITVRMIRALVAGARREPGLNAWFKADGPERLVHPQVHAGIAVDTPDGLFVSTLRDADSKTPAQLREDINRLRDNVANRSIPPEDLSGYTLMLSNVGVYAGKYTSPVITPPCVAILATGKMRSQVVACHGAIAVHPVIPISLTFDHRAVTGGEAARFLAAFLEDLGLPN